MSYILDALRRAERERRVPRVPTLDAVHRPVSPRRRSLWPWLGGGVLLVAALNGAVLAWLWRGGIGEPPAPAPAPVAAVAVAVPPSVPVPVVAEAPAAPAPRSPVVAVVAPVTPAAPTAVIAPAAPPAPAPPVPPTSPAPSTTMAVAPPARAPILPAPSSPGPAAPAEAAGPLREAATRMSLDVLVFSEEDAARFVFINGRKLVEGQTVEGDIVVEAITREGAVLTLAGERLVLRPKSNPYLR